jgi:hypothetical protein
MISRKIAWLLVLFAVLLTFVSFGMANAQCAPDGQFGDCLPDSFTNWHDSRFYHESVPEAEKIHNLGGWMIGYTYEFPLGTRDPGIDHLIRFKNETKNQSITLDPNVECYDYFGQLAFCDALFWMGSGSNAMGTWTAHQIFNDGLEAQIPVGFDYNNNEPIWEFEVQQDKPIIPVVTIHRIRQKRNGSFVIRYSAPETEGAHIRLRTVDRIGGDFLDEYRSDQPSGEAIGLEMGHRKRIVIDPGYAEFGRFEYRPAGGYGRTVMFFKFLP